MMVINDFIKINAESLTELYIYIIRFIQGCIVVGLIPLYLYMFKSRQKYYKSLNTPEKEAAKVK